MLCSPKPPCAPLMQEQCPWLLPSPLNPRPSLAPTPPVQHLSFLQDSLGGWAGRAVPSPRSWETSGPHIREDQPVNLISWDVTSRGPSLHLVFALTGLMGYLLHPCSSRENPPHPQTSSRAQPVTTSRCDTVALHFYLESQADHTVPCHPRPTQRQARHGRKEDNLKPR